jgi:hypothetical protein
MDLGSALGAEVASSTGETTLLWTAPSTATYVFSTGDSGGDSLQFFRPGCVDPAVLANEAFLSGPLSSPPHPQTVQSLDLVEGQAIAVRVGVDVANPDFELSITQNSTVAGTCCSPHFDQGCSDPIVESDVCAADGYCCGTHWDLNCSTAARLAYDANCITD